MNLSGRLLPVDAERLGSMAVEALVLEASLEGKPGLVCPGVNGAHEDMDHAMFLRSARSLEKCFIECARLGLSFGGGDPADLLPLLRPVGLEGERRMFEATGGVNTHKGAIFSLGLLLAATGLVVQRRAENLGGSHVPGTASGDGGFDAGRYAGSGTGTGTEACLMVSAMCRGIVQREGDPSGATAGLRFQAALGIRGARGEAEAGYPLIRETLLPLMRKRRRLGDPGKARRAALGILLESMANLDDTCLLSRGGLEGLELCKAGAAEVLLSGGAGSVAGSARLERLDRELCERRLSPGGSADMLASTFMLDMVERYVDIPQCRTVRRRVHVLPGPCPGEEKIK
jgi:triphosphoribosyl-dephospho-CoA synthetase